MKKIAIPAWSTGENSFGIGKAYGEWIRKFGQLVILNPDDPFREDIDLLILPGGLDVNPASNADTSQLSLYTGNSNPMLEYFDTHILPDYIENDTPILGICRGAQRLYGIFGGELIQHNYTHIQSQHPKHQVHGLGWMTEEYYERYSTMVDLVNSRHHQTMVYNLHNKKIEVMAVAREYHKKEGNIDYTDFADIVEVFKIVDKNIYGFQYHPEDNLDDLFSTEIVNNLLIAKI